MAMITYREREADRIMGLLVKASKGDMDEHEVDEACAEAREFLSRAWLRGHEDLDGMGVEALLDALTRGT